MAHVYPKTIMTKHKYSDGNCFLNPCKLMCRYRRSLRRPSRHTACMRGQCNMLHTQLLSWLLCNPYSTLHHMMQPSDCILKLIDK